MAVQNITIAYPDAQQARIIAALKAAATTPLIPAPTNAQALAWFVGACQNVLKDVVLRHERDAAVAGVIAPDVT